MDDCLRFPSADVVFPYVVDTDRWQGCVAHVFCLLCSCTWVPRFFFLGGLFFRLGRIAACVCGFIVAFLFPFGLNAKFSTSGPFRVYNEPCGWVGQIVWQRWVAFLERRFEVPWPQQDNEDIFFACVFLWVRLCDRGRAL